MILPKKKNRELKEDKLKDSLILLARHSFIYTGDVKSIGKLCTQIIADTLDISRAGFWLYNTNHISCDVLFTKSSQQFTSGDILNDKDFVDFFTLLRKEPFVMANDAPSHIYTKELKETYLRKYHIQSLLFVPIIHNQQIIGVLSQEQTHKQRVWQKIEINFLFQVAELISLCFSLNERNLLEEEQKQKMEDLSQMVERLKTQIR